jgi:hypothetical protein
MTDFLTVVRKHEPVLLFFIFIFYLNVKISRAKIVKFFSRPIINTRVEFQMGHRPHRGQVQALHLSEEPVAEIEICQTVETCEGSPESEKFNIEKL